MTRWNHCAVHCPATPESPSKRVRTDTGLNGPLGETLRATVPLDTASVSPVAVLLNRRGPIAILGRIRSVVVAALQRVSRWTLAHVGQKLQVVGEPFWAYRDAPTAVIGVTMIIGVQASFLHGTPTTIGWRVMTFPRMSVCCSPLRHECASIASATFGSAGCKVSTSMARNGSAAAATFPDNVMASALIRWTENRQISELQSSQIARVPVHG